MGRLDGDSLLGVRIEIPRLVRAGPQTLNGIENIFLLGKKGVAKILRPVEFVVHRLEDLWERHQRLDADVP